MFEMKNLSLFQLFTEYNDGPIFEATIKNCQCSEKFALKNVLCTYLSIYI